MNSATINFRPIHEMRLRFAKSQRDASWNTRRTLSWRLQLWYAVSQLKKFKS